MTGVVNPVQQSLERALSFPDDAAGRPHDHILGIQCRALERAIQATLETRGRKIAGGGTEWFKATRDEVLAIYKFITQNGGS